MATVRAIVAVAGLLFLGAARDASRADARDGLVGTTWHTVRIDGDAMFFFIEDVFIKAVGIRFEDQGRFVAAVRFIDGQKTFQDGTCRVVKACTILPTIEGLGRRRSCGFDAKGGIVVQDRAYDVTVRLAPGKLEEERWF
jgi:hypothetical protein